MKKESLHTLCKEAKQEGLSTRLGYMCNMDKMEGLQVVKCLHVWTESVKQETKI